MGSPFVAAIELIGLFLILPVAIAVDWLPAPVLPVLAAVAIIAALRLFFTAPAKLRLQWRAIGDLEKSAFRRVLVRFLAGSAVMIALVLLLWPTRLFALPAQAPAAWLAIVVLYPLISVYPQELVCRAYFFLRYAPLFPRRRLMVLGSALAFASIHIVYGNIPAVLLSGIAGLFLADTYARTASLKLVWIEHSLYGIAVFTVGLGPFFDQSYSGPGIAAPVLG